MGMKQAQCYENYPLWIVLVSNLVSLATYAIGAGIIYMFGAVWALLYVLYVLALELRLILRHCPDCYYYGRTCAFGQGRLSALVARKGSPKRMACGKATMLDILPDFMVSVIPIIAGIALLVGAFSWVMLAAVATLFILGFAGNAFVRGQLACSHCMQRKLGCPAAKLFGMKSK
jgi:hypothetical protein